MNINSNYLAKIQKFSQKNEGVGLSIEDSHLTYPSPASDWTLGQDAVICQDSTFYFLLQ